MKYLTLLSIGPLLAACASDPPPPAASSATVDAATDNPSASTTPVQTDVMRAAEADRRAENAATANTRANPTSTTANTNDTTNTNPPGQRSTDTAPVADNAASTPAPAAAPDNTRVNSRDRSGDTLTPGDQGGSEADRKLTQQIRQAVMKDNTLSFGAKNVKIITVNGKVTLRGPVNTEQERTAIEAAAKKIAGAAQVENLLEVKK
jgi:osmotically-inducible protein OsmY